MSKLPSKSFILKKVDEAFAKGDYQKGVQIAVYYAAAKAFQNPHKFTKILLKAVEKWQKEHPNVDLP